MTTQSVQSYLKRNKLILLFILFSFVFFFFAGRYIAKREDKYSNLLNATHDTMVEYKTLSGKTAYMIKERIVDNIRDKIIKDSLAKELKISKKEIEKLVLISSSSNFSGIKTSKKDTLYINAKGDTITGSYGYYEDPWVTAGVLINKDSLEFTELETRDTISAVFQKIKEKGITYNKLIVTNKSPYGKITGLDNISLQQPKEYRRLSIGFSTGFQIPSFNPYIGVGITYPIFRFRK